MRSSSRASRELQSESDTYSSKFRILGYFDCVTTEVGLLLLSFSYDIFKIVIEILEYYVLDQFPLLSLTVEQILDLDYIGATLEHIQHFVLAAHPLPHLFYPF